MRSLIHKLRRGAANLAPGMLTGAFAWAILGSLIRAESGEGRPLGWLLVGAVYGLVTVALVRLFPIAPWGYPIAGLLSGPLPIALLMDESGPEQQGAIFFAMLVGLLVGFLEWARAARHRSGAK